MPAPPLFASAVRPADIFDPWSADPVTTWDQLNSRIDTILRKHGESPLVWRGVSDSSWGLYSSLYRRLKKASPNVSEEDLVKEELGLLARARREWRLDHMGALEIFAHIQHYGGPTRLLDVTSNPLIAAWFAVEQKWLESGDPEPDTDGRVFCFYVGEYVELDQEWGARIPPWVNWLDNPTRKIHNWGTGQVRRVWRPPAYNARISAQNAAFLLDGAPFGFEGSNTFTKAPGQTDRWTVAELKDASSIPLKLNQAGRSRATEHSTPAFSFTIARSARASIRKRLEEHYGYSPASLYADLFGLAQNAAPHLPL